MPLFESMWLSVRAVGWEHVSVQLAPDDDFVIYDQL